MKESVDSGLGHVQRSTHGAQTQFFSSLLSRYKLQAFLCAVGLFLSSPVFAQSQVATSTEPLVPLQLNVPIPGLLFAKGILPQGDVLEIPYLAQYIAAAYSYLLGIGFIAAAVMIVFGGFKYILASSIQSVQTGQKIIKEALIGLLLLLMAFIVLQTLSPGTVGLRTLKILQIKKEEFKAGTSKLFQGSSKENYCDKIPSNTPQLFTPVSKTASVSVGSLTVSGPALKDYTLCGVNYTSDQTGETCTGRRCSNQQEHCVTCSDATKAFPECTGKSSACIAGSMFGNINWQDGSVPFGLSVMIVCSGAIKDKFTTWTEMSKPESVISVGRVPLLTEVDRSKDKGAVAWKFLFPPLYDEAVKKKCADTGQTFVGLYLEIDYAAARDTPRAAGDIVFTGGAKGIIVKKDCGSVQPFSGYGDSSGLHPFICGEYFTRNLKPDAPLRKKLGAEEIKQLQQISDLLRDPKSYWSLDEIKTAQETLAPLACDIQLNKINAPARADVAFYGQACGHEGFSGALKVLNFY